MHFESIAPDAGPAEEAIEMARTAGVPTTDDAEPITEAARPRAESATPIEELSIEAPGATAAARIETAPDPTVPARDARGARARVPAPAPRADTRPPARPSGQPGAQPADHVGVQPVGAIARDVRIEPGDDPSADHGATAPQLRRFIKSRAYVPMHELRRRFAINGGDDDVTAVEIDRGRVYVGLPEREGRLLGELLRGGDIGVELSMDPVSPIVVGVYPMRPVSRG